LLTLLAQDGAIVFLHSKHLLVVGAVGSNLSENDLAENVLQLDQATEPVQLASNVKVRIPGFWPNGVLGLTKFNASSISN